MSLSKLDEDPRSFRLYVFMTTIYFSLGTWLMVFREICQIFLIGRYILSWGVETNMSNPKSSLILGRQF